MCSSDLVFERYPHVRIAFGESGCGWIPYALDRMDFEWEDRFFDLGLKMKPSDYWRRQCKATFQFDRIGAKLIDDMGAESLMWGSDYPHGDGVWPHSDKYIREQFADVPAEQVKKAKAILNRANERHHIIGRIVRGTRTVTFN